MDRIEKEAVDELEATIEKLKNVCEEAKELIGYCVICSSMNEVDTPRMEKWLDKAHNII